MNSSRIKLLVVLGCALIVVGASLLALGTETVKAQSDQPVPEYVGASDCGSCHRNLARTHNDSRHALALQDVGREKDAILADFEQGEDVRTVLLPGEETVRAFTADDIAFVIGSGQRVQRYLYEVDRNDYMVLPAEWDVASNTWQPLRLAETWPDESFDWEQNCASCHTTGFEVERGRWEDDGVQCEACHGPASNHIEQADDAGRRPNEEELLAIRSSIYTTPDSQVCGQCHSVGTSPDGFPYPVGYVPGVDLNQSFQLVSSDSTNHWWVTGHASQPNMQYNEWLNNTHASSLTDLLKSEDAEDSCLACHSQDYRQNVARIAAVEAGDREGDPPEPVTLANAKTGLTCTTCHNQHADSDQAFELVDEANALCMSCHTDSSAEDGIHHPNKEMFEGVALVNGIESIASPHFSAEDGPRCATCHLQQVPVADSSRASHLFKTVIPGEVGVAPPSACSGCHDGLTSTDLQLLVEDTRESVRSRLVSAQAKLEGILAPNGDTEDVTRYEQAASALVFVQNDGSLGIHNYAYTDALLTSAEVNLTLLSGSAVMAESTTAPPVAVATEETPQSASVSEIVVPNGIQPVTIVIIGAVIGGLLFAAFAFFRKSGV